MTDEERKQKGIASLRNGAIVGLIFGIIMVVTGKSSLAKGKSAFIMILIITAIGAMAGLAIGGKMYGARGGNTLSRN